MRLNLTLLTLCIMATMLIGCNKDSDLENGINVSESNIKNNLPILTITENNSNCNSERSYYAKLRVNFRAEDHMGNIIEQSNHNTMVSVSNIKVTAIKDDQILHHEESLSADSNKIAVFILSGDATVKIETTYQIRTIDRHLQKGYSEIKSTVTKTFKSRNFIAGNNYEINVILNLENMQFSGEVSGWN